MSHFLTHFPCIWNVSGMLDSPSRHLECPGCAELMWSISGTLDSSEVSQMHCNNPHTIWNVTDKLELPSCCLEHFRSPSQCLECPRRVRTALMPSETLVFTFTLSGLFQIYWLWLYKTQTTMPLLDSQANSYRGMSLAGLIYTLNHALLYIVSV
jgi:hypothetical protein